VNAVEIDESFTSFEQWMTWKDTNRWVADPEYIDALVATACRDGIESPWLGAVGPEEMEVSGPQYRESLKARGLISRARAVLDTFASAPEAAGLLTSRIYAPEALSPFALEMRGRYARFVGSEYARDDATRASLFPIGHEDLAQLSFLDASFDVVICNDVFEHVPELARALAETSRVLRTGGTLLATFPFAHHQQDTIIRAVRTRGDVQFIGEPEYHDDPLDPRGALVYQIPGWDILDQLHDAGFAHAENLFISSVKRGICANKLAGMFVLRAVA
jgi:SAM-dependent methyltransferase